MFDIFKQFCLFICRDQIDVLSEMVKALQLERGELKKSVEDLTSQIDQIRHDSAREFKILEQTHERLIQHHREFVHSCFIPDYECEGYGLRDVLHEKILENFRRKVYTLKALLEGRVSDVPEPEEAIKRLGLNRDFLFKSLGERIKE